MNREDSAQLIRSRRTLLNESTLDFLLLHRSAIKEFMKEFTLTKPVKVVVDLTLDLFTPTLGRDEIAGLLLHAGLLTTTHCERYDRHTVAISNENAREFFEDLNKLDSILPLLIDLTHFPTVIGTLALSYLTMSDFFSQLLPPIPSFARMPHFFASSARAPASAAAGLDKARLANEPYCLEPNALIFLR